MRFKSDETGGQPDNRHYPAVEINREIQRFGLAGVAVLAGASLTRVRLTLMPPSSRRLAPARSSERRRRPTHLSTASTYDVSEEQGPNADLTIQPAETDVAKAQAARFSSVCRVWSPMYRQVTLSALLTGGLAALNTAYDSLLSAWQYYLQHLNDGRPFVLLGHSQGAAMLIRLIAEQIDPNPSLRRRLVTAILAGGNLQVPTGQTVGATFNDIPVCTSTSRAGCVIAYSTFGTQPPADSLFGRPGPGVSLMSPQPTTAGQQVACVNPASIAGGTAGLSPYFPEAGSVPWVSYPRLYTASCESANGATWLQVNTIQAPAMPAPWSLPPSARLGVTTLTTSTWPWAT